MNISITYLFDRV